MAEPVVTDEMVRAYNEAWWAASQSGREDETRVGLAAAAPLIVEHYLRQRIRSAEVDQTPEEVWEQVRQVAVHAATRTAVVDALRVLYWHLRERTSAFRASGGNEPYALGLEEAAAAVAERLDELERGTDR